MSARVIVDTSIWIEYFNNPDSREKGEVDSLLEEDCVFLTGIILAELLQGTRSQQEFDILRSSLSALPFCETSFNIWVEAGHIASSLRRKGVTLPLSDCTIAALALENDCAIYTLDSHFARMEKIRLHEPSASGP